MDFHNLCQKLDIDGIKAKLPPLPPALKQIKLPKSIPKLKSRKIFRSSRENVNNNGSIKSNTRIDPAIVGGDTNQHLKVPPPPPPSEFIKQTPTRISTISSLMHQENMEYYQSSNTYRSAGRIDDDFPTPTTQIQSRFNAMSQQNKPISPIRIPNTGSGGNGGNDTGSASGSSKQNLSFGQKLQKGYKDIADFKFKHIFARKTVLRKDNIEVAHYVQRYNEDLAKEEREQRRRDAEIADDYRIHFTLSRQNTVDSKESDEAIEEDQMPSKALVKKPKSVGDHSGDESGMETSPPARKPGIASSRFAKVRNPPEDMSLEDNFEEAIITNPNDQEPDKKPSSRLQSSKFKDRMKSLKSKYLPSGQEKAKNPAPSSATPQSSDEETEDKKATTTTSKSDLSKNTINALKNNLNRLQKSIKRPGGPPQRSGSTDDDGGDDYPEEKENLKIKALKLKARLKQFRSSDDVNESRQNKSENEEHSTKSPTARANFSSKLQNWKKSFKRQASEGDVQQHTEDENSSPEKGKRSDTLIKKLKYIRARKKPNSNEELDNTGNSSDPGTSKISEGRKFRNIEEKFQQARQRTFKKVNDKMHSIKIFQKDSNKDSNDPKPEKEASESDEEKPKSKPKPKPQSKTSISKVRKDLQEEEEEDLDLDSDEVEEIQNLQKPYAKWTSKPIHSDSLDTDDPDSEFPRVLIHQDNTDVFESTLIIAVTRSPSVATPRTPPTITEITESPKKSEWIPNSEIIKGFRSLTPADFCSEKSKVPALTESKTPETIKPELNLKKRTSAGDLRESLAAKDPWRVETISLNKEKIYKTKSIDIFEATKANIMTAFDNFDEELRNEPVLKIINNVDNYERESSEDPDAADDDNSSRVTKIEMKPPGPAPATVLAPPSSSSQSLLVEVKPFDKMPSLRQIGNSQESLIAQKGESEDYEVDSDYEYDENEDDEDADADEDEDEDRPPSNPPSPPPSMSPPPPPLPERKAAIRTSIRVNKKDLNRNPLSRSPSPSPSPPPLPKNRPPLPANKPNRTLSLQQQENQKTLPKIPERTPSMNRISQPLVKTASLRLAYNEQVKLTDVGKVNKLISHFEQPQPKSELKQRPRLIPRTRDYSQDYSDDDDDNDEQVQQTKPKRPQSLSIIQDKELPQIKPFQNNPEITITKPPRTNNKMKIPNLSEMAFNTEPFTKPTNPKKDQINNNLEDGDANLDFKSPLNSSKDSLNTDSNFNYSLPNSEYGSPLAYPSSLIGSTETTPTLGPKLHHQSDDLLNESMSRRSRRSMTRDNESFYSFDSDEENSYYSITSSTSNRYVVEL